MAIFCIILILFVTALNPATAYSYDERYLDYSSWKDEKVNVLNVSNGVEGSIKYFSDSTSVYFLFDLSENGICSDSDVSFVFDIECSDKTYNIVASQNGIEFTEDAQKYIDVGFSVENYDTGQSIAAVLMDLNDKIYSHNFKIKAYVDGHIYKLTKNTFEVKTTPPPTTTKPTTTRKTSDKTTKANTTKVKTTVSKSSATTKQKSSNTQEKTTKFKAPEDFSEETVIENTEEELLEYPIDEAEKGKESLTSKSKALLIAAIVIGFVGFAFVILYLYLKKKPEKMTDDEISDDE